MFSLLDASDSTLDSFGVKLVVLRPRWFCLEFDVLPLVDAEGAGVGVDAGAGAGVLLILVGRV